MAGRAAAGLPFGLPYSIWHRGYLPPIVEERSCASAHGIEHEELALQGYEVRMESHFAAALGLLWWILNDELDAALRERRKELPQGGSVYETMAVALPNFRELLTCFFAF